MASACDPHAQKIWMAAAVGKQDRMGGFFGCAAAFDVCVPPTAPSWLSATFSSRPSKILNHAPPHGKKAHLSITPDFNLSRSDETSHFAVRSSELDRIIINLHSH